MKIEPVFGIEIECSYNDNLFGIPCNYGKHPSPGHRYSRFFHCETDGSLEGTDNFYGTAEIISIPFQSKNVDKILREFKEETYRRISESLCISIKKAKEYRLKDIFEFDESCGCHIHVTPLVKSKNRYTLYYKTIPYKFYGDKINIRKIMTIDDIPPFYKKIKQKIRGVVTNSLYRKFTDHFYRDFAMEIFDEDDLYSARHDDRYYSLNFTLGPERFEFRSFNLLGVKTWDQFNTMIKTGVLAIEEYMNERIIPKLEGCNKDEPKRS